MKRFDLFKLLVLKSLRIVWLCVVFAFLFAMVFFISFASQDMLSGIYNQIIDDADGEYCIMNCSYSESLSDYSFAGIYSSDKNITYDVIIEYDDTSIAMDKFNRGLNITSCLNEWKDCFIGLPIQQGQKLIWIYQDYYDKLQLINGSEIFIKGNDTTAYTVAGTYNDELIKKLKSGYTPAFITFENLKSDSSVVVVCAKNVLNLYKSELSQFIFNDNGIMDMCAGYELSRICLDILFCISCSGALFIAFKCFSFFISFNARQTRILIIFGLSKKSIALNYIIILALFGVLSLALGIAVFYIFYDLTQYLSTSILGMTQSPVSIGIYCIIGYALYAIIATLSVIMLLKKKNFAEIAQ